MIEITTDESGVTLPVRVQPKASGERVVGEHNGSLKIAVTAAPEAGKANEAVIALLAKRLQVAKSAVSIIAGSTARQKRVHIEGVSSEYIKKLLDLK